MDTSTPEYARLLDAITACLAEHDLSGVMDHGAPADEYAPEAADFARYMAAGRTITPDVVATVWHEWFGDSADTRPEPASAMEALAADLQAIRNGFAQN